MMMAALLLTLPLLAAAGPDTVTLDGGGWLRRDWRRCQDPTRIQTDAEGVTFQSVSSAALLWQVPTLDGPAPVDGRQEWVLSCDRPPRSHHGDVRRELGDRLLDVEEYGQVTWRWWVDAPLDDAAIADRSGRIRPERDDFAAKLGISIVEEGKDVLREIAYVWSGRLPEETVLYQETTVIPLVWKQRYHRIVAESGAARAGRWVTESRDLRADYRRLFPGSEPGRVVRVYLMADSDQTRSRVTTRFADLAFHRRRP
jgi:hypothetical protein